jgi:hypothetical protein
VTEVDATSSSGPRTVTAASHYDAPPQEVEADGSPTWITRADTFVVLVTKARRGAVLVQQTPDESMLLLPPGVSAKVATVEEGANSTGDTLMILPPGTTEITLPEGGLILRVMSTRAVRQAAQAVNADLYSDIPPPGDEPPPPPGGFRLRSYFLGNYDSADGRLIRPRIFRSTNLMLNAFASFDRLRPVDDMRPHWHDDFEQASVALTGDWIHDIRTPWGNDMRLWRDDQHIALGSPSTCIIPATLIHGTRNQTPGALLVDVFAPPRTDFARAGVVLNAMDYPSPDDASGMSGRDVPAAWIQKKEKA